MSELPASIRPAVTDGAGGRFADDVCHAHLLITAACADARFRSAAVFVALTAVMPCVLMVIPVVIVIVIAFAWRRNDAARCKQDQSQQEAAFGNGF
jgi:hypothetical protein